MTVETLVQTSVLNDKNLYYIRLTNTTGKQHAINVGEKTYETIKKLIEEDSKKQQFQEPQIKKANGK